jgi:hypothetical protein
MRVELFVVLFAAAPSNVVRADPQRVACPARDVLTKRLGAGVRNVPPNDWCDRWSNLGAVACAPIGLPQAGWYIVTNLYCATRVQYLELHLAVEAGTWKILATGDGGKLGHVSCESKIRSIEDHDDAPSSVAITQVCTHKDDKPVTINRTAEISPPKIVVRTN